MRSHEKRHSLLLQRPYIISLIEGDPPAALESAQYVRMEVRHCGICGTDLAFYRGRKEASYPRTLGREYWRIIAAVGEQVIGWKAGDRVAVDLNYRCGTCDFCRSGASQRRSHRGVEPLLGEEFGLPFRRSGAKGVFPQFFAFERRRSSVSASCGSTCCNASANFPQLVDVRPLSNAEEVFENIESSPFNKTVLEI